jgi:geranylgeranyl diphosphate synthase type II
MHSYKELLKMLESHLEANRLQGYPSELYEPAGYILGLGGKRLRPVLLLMAAELFGAEVEKALPAAAAIEVFHNFTLVHDDIMDKAPLRRGQPTVHHKWSETVGILSGDLMMIHSIDLLCLTPANDIRQLLSVFTRAAIEVCEGQQLDMNFESRNDVTVDEYMGMITLKTAALLGAALQLGAIIAGADDADATALAGFGRHIGIAFQVQDDILDAFGDDAVGKKIGGDIISNKKTLLYLDGLRMAGGAERERLTELYASKPANPDAKVEEVLSIFNRLDVRAHAELLKQLHLEKAFASFDAVKAESGRKEILRNTARELMDRVS